MTDERMPVHRLKRKPTFYLELLPGEDCYCIGKRVIIAHPNRGAVYVWRDVAGVLREKNCEIGGPAEPRLILAGDLPPPGAGGPTSAP